MILDIKPALNLISSVLCIFHAMSPLWCVLQNLKLHPFYNFHLLVTFIPNEAGELTFLGCTCQDCFVAQRDSLSSA